MTLRKITIANSVKHIPQSEQTRGVKLNMIKNISNPRKQNKIISKKNKKIFKNVAAGGFGFLR